MTPSPDFDRRLTAWLDDRAYPLAPEELLSETLSKTSRMRRRPLWRIPERWIPMPITMRLAVVPRAVIILLMLTVLALAATAGAFVAGSLRSATMQLPPPTGPARNGLLAYDSGGDIWVINPDGTRPNRLTSGPELDISPAWSRDGTHIAFWSIPRPVDADPSVSMVDLVQGHLADEAASVVVIDADGSDRHVIAEGLSITGVNFPLSWSSEGRHLVMSHTVESVETVAVLSLDGSPPTDLAPGQTPSWSPDGSLIAYKSPPTPNGVMVMAPDGTGVRQVTTTPGSGMAFYRAQWSPNGGQIVFYAGSDGAHDVWTVSADGTDEVVIGNDRRDEYWPSWSPTGSRIVFSRVISNAENRPTYVVVDVDGGNELVLDSIPRQFVGAAAGWSPDGELLVGGDWAADMAAFDLHLIDPSGVADVRTIPIADNVGEITWQRLAP